MNWAYKQSVMRYHLKHRGLKGLIMWLAHWLIFSRRLWLVGKVIELGHNVIRIDGARFSIGTPLISTRRKGNFLVLHEVYERIAIRQHLDPRFPVVEFGGGIGVVSCLTNRMLVQPDQHVVVEPNSGLIPLLETNRHMNGCGFRIIEGALAYDGDTVDLYQANSVLGLSAARHTGQKISAATVTLEHILDQFHFDNITVICDIEGAEVDLIMHEVDILKQRVRMLIVELHPSLVGMSATEQMLERLHSLGFEKIDETHPTPSGTSICIFSRDVQQVEG